MNVDERAKMVLDLIKEKGYTPFYINKYVVISTFTIDRVLKGTHKPTRTTVEQLFSFLVQMGDIKPDNAVTSLAFTNEDLMIISTSVYYQKMWVEKHYGGDASAKYAALLEKLQHITPE